jgi:hypothetical protein
MLVAFIVAGFASGSSLVHGATGPRISFRQAIKESRNA